LRWYKLTRIRKKRRKKQFPGRKTIRKEKKKKLKVKIKEERTEFK